VISSIDTSFASLSGLSLGLVMVAYDIMRSLPRDCTLGSNDLDPVEDCKSIIFVPYFLHKPYISAFPENSLVCSQPSSAKEPVLQ
jgi:hypothetical protein